MTYRVKYRVSGFEQEFEAGPYSAEEVNLQLFDIAGYEGVFGARIELDPEEHD